MTGVPAIRIRAIHDCPPRADGDRVVYWMIANRRTRWNFALERAVELARGLRKPLVVLEALRCGYPWASDRLHQFVLDGMADNARRLARSPVLYYPYVEPEPDAGKGLLAALADRACAVVTDDFPAFMLPRMVEAASRQVEVRFEAVDSNGLLPLRAASKVYPTAYAFRRFLQKELPQYLGELPRADVLAGSRLPRLERLPAGLIRRWPRASDDLLRGAPGALDDLPVDHGVPPGPIRGGAKAAESALRRFLADVLPVYAERRNRPEEEATSGLSPYLHFGHVSAHQVFHELAAHEGWSPASLSAKATGAREGWWGTGRSAEAFLDQLVTWRELGHNLCWQRPDYDRYRSLPQWARDTLAEHAPDPRPTVYDLDRLESASTHDPLWNAAQTQLVREGRIHNYLRMLWGKKILEWSPGPREALDAMIRLNDRYALDGRDPNSYSGIFWCLGRYDRPWGPERPIFGKIRYMSSKNTARKVPVKDYVRRYGP